MSIASEIAAINALIAENQAKLAILQSLPEDTYPFGTVVVLAFNNDTKIHYVKTGEEAWKAMKGISNTENELGYWIYINKTLTPGIYFEVYVLTPAALPIYASA